MTCGGRRQTREDLLSLTGKGFRRHTSLVPDSSTCAAAAPQPTPRARYPLAPLRLAPGRIGECVCGTPLPPSAEGGLNG